MRDRRDDFNDNDQIPGEAWKDMKVKEKKELLLMLPQRRRNSLVLAFHLHQS